MESLYAFDASGNMVLSKTGGQRDIELSLLEVARLRDTVLTHNHPRGTSFSGDDVQVATVADLVEIRVVTRQWRFSLRRPAAGWDLAFFRRSLDPAYRRHLEEVVHDFLIALIDGTMSEAEADTLYAHEAWTRVAMELGLEYRREE
jgi:hypothetical protein